MNQILWWSPSLPGPQRAPTSNLQPVRSVWASKHQAHFPIFYSLIGWHSQDNIFKLFQGAGRRIYSSRSSLASNKTYERQSCDSTWTCEASLLKTTFCYAAVIRSRCHRSALTFRSMPPTICTTASKWLRSRALDVRPDEFVSSSTSTSSGFPVHLFPLLN